MSLIGFTPRNHPQQQVRDQVDDRQTPLSVFAPLNAEHHFTLDAAASDANALCAKHFTRDTDGLLWPWDGERVWVNPPFSRLEAWVAKVWREMRGGGSMWWSCSPPPIAANKHGGSCTSNRSAICQRWAA